MDELVRENNILYPVHLILDKYGKSTKTVTSEFKAKLSNKKKTLFIIVDGLGYNFLKQKQGSFLLKHCLGKLQSFYPSTTAACITSFYTGLTPYQHGIISWSMWYEEMNAVILPLPGITTFEKNNIDAEYYNKLLELPSWTSSLSVKTVSFLPREISQSRYNSFFKFDKLCGYSSFIELEKQVSEDMQEFEYGQIYIDLLDKTAHDYGISDSHSDEVFKKIDSFIERLHNQLNDVDVVVVSDHGFNDVLVKNRIIVNEHKELQKLLSCPVYGEPRLAFLRAPPENVKQIVSYISTSFQESCTIHTVDEFLSLTNCKGEMHKNLRERIGTLVLEMKPGYAIKEFLPSAPQKFKIGYHGGTSDDEMYVPFIIIST